MERGLRAKTNIIEDTPMTDIKELCDKMDIEDKTTQVFIKLIKEWDDLPQKDKDKIIDVFCKLPN